MGNNLRRKTNPCDICSIPKNVVEYTISSIRDAVSPECGRIIQPERHMALCDPCYDKMIEPTLSDHEREWMALTPEQQNESHRKSAMELYGSADYPPHSEIYDYD